MLREDFAEEDLHCVPEEDGVGDLHHRGLEVQGEEHALLLRILDLGLQKLDERALAHEGCVEDLAGQNGQ